MKKVTHPTSKTYQAALGVLRERYREEFENIYEELLRQQGFSTQKLRKRSRQVRILRYIFEQSGCTLDDLRSLRIPISTLNVDLRQMEKNKWVIRPGTGCGRAGQYEVIERNVAKILYEKQ